MSVQVIVFILLVIKMKSFTEQFKGEHLEQLVTALPVNTWKVQVVILQALYKFVDRYTSLLSPVLKAQTYMYFIHVHSSNLTKNQQGKRFELRKES
jgi:hypothetical protein